VLVHGWQTIFERGVVRSREPFQFWWAPIISFCGTIDRLRYRQRRCTVSVVN